MNRHHHKIWNESKDSLSILPLGEKYNSCPNLNYVFASALTLSHFDDEEFGGATEADEQSWGSHYQAHLNKQKSMANLTNLLGTNRGKQNSRTTNNKATFHGSIFRTDSWKDNMFISSASLISSVESLSNIVERDRNFIKELRIKGNPIQYIQVQLIFLEI